MKLLLTEKEVDQLTEEWLDADEDVDWADMMNKAQLKKVWDWGDEACSDKEHHPRYDHMLKRVCPICWQVLLKEIEDD